MEDNKVAVDESTRSSEPIVLYAVLHAGIKGLLRLIAHRRTEI